MKTTETKMTEAKMTPDPVRWVDALYMPTDAQYRTPRPDVVATLACDILNRGWSEESCITHHGSVSFDAKSWAAYIPAKLIRVAPVVKTVKRDGEAVQVTTPGYWTDDPDAAGEAWSKDRILLALSQLDGQPARGVQSGHHRAGALMVCGIVCAGIMPTHKAAETRQEGKADAALSNFRAATLARMSQADAIKAVLAMMDAGRVTREADIPAKRGMQQRLYAQALLARKGVPVETAAKLDKEQARTTAKLASAKAQETAKTLAQSGTPTTRAIPAPTLREAAERLKGSSEAWTGADVSDLLGYIADGNDTAFQTATAGNVTPDAEE